MSRIVVGIFLGALCISNSAVAGAVQSKRFDAPKIAERTVTAGRMQRLSAHFLVDGSCRSRGYVTVNVIEKPSVGQLYTTHSDDYPQFSSGSPVYKCNTRKMPAVMLSYKAPFTFKGVDTFKLEFVDSFGTPGIIEFRVTVRSPEDQL